MTQKDFEEGKIYIYVGAFTRKCFRYHEGVLESHYENRRGDKWCKALGWSKHRFFDEKAMLCLTGSYFITPEDHLMACLGNMEQL